MGVESGCVGNMWHGITCEEHKSLFHAFFLGHQQLVGTS